MLFNTPLFLFAFFPVVLLFTYIAGYKLKTTLLFVFSLLFYAFFAQEFVSVLISSVLLNYIASILIYKYKGTSIEKPVFYGSIALNIFALILFKYHGFFTEQINDFYAHSGQSGLGINTIIYITGISFFTFQGISYLTDIYRGKHLPEIDIIRFGLYISFFPKLLAGPLLRYNQFQDALYSNNSLKLEMLTQGIKRFIIGLSKKVLIADILAKTSTLIFALDHSFMSTPIAWLGIILFVLRLYYDISGYTDMAIGIGQMFGFTFPENFKRPFQARSLTDFYERWHITLLNWFRDYVYAPLFMVSSAVINRKVAMFFSILIAFILFGCWHGATISYLLFGVFTGLIIAFESLFLKKTLEKTPKYLQHIYTLFLILSSFLLFRINNLHEFVDYYTTLFGFNHTDNYYNISNLLNSEFLVVLILSLIFMTNIFNHIITAINKYIALNTKDLKILQYIRFFEAAFYFAVFLTSVAFMTENNYLPFIYFQF